MKTAIIYHKIDFDGICSYTVIRQYAEMNGDEVTAFPYNNNEPFAHDLSGFDRIVVADICLPPLMMKRLAAESPCRLIWIDHHRSSIAESAEYGFNEVPGFREIGKGACEICYEYFFKRSAPRFIQMLSAYDVWDKGRFDWEEETLPVQYGARNRWGLDAESFYNAVSGGGDALAESVLQEGKAVVKYVRTTGRYSCQTYAFEAVLGRKVKALCLMTPMFGALAMEENARERGCDVCLCVNRREDGRYKISVFGDCGIDLGDYMKKTYGGGGHASAAGAVVDEKVFLRLLRRKTV